MRDSVELCFSRLVSLGFWSLIGLRVQGLGVRLSLDLLRTLA